MGFLFDRYWFVEFKALRCYFQQVYFETPGADTGRALRKKVSQSFNKIHRKTPLLGQSCNFIKKEASSQMFSCEFCKIFRKTFLTEHLRVTASETRTILDWPISQLIFTCSKSTIETLKKVWNILKVKIKTPEHQLLTCFTFFSYYFYCWLWTSKC